MPDLSKVTGILPDLADYLVYGAIAIVTLIGFFKCLLPLWRTTSSLRRAISRLQAEAGQTTDKPVWQTSGFVGKRLRGTWLRFLQNAEQLDRHIREKLETYSALAQEVYTSVEQKLS